MRNAAGKPFSAVKALPIALDVVNGDNLVKLARDEKERERTRKRTNAVPTHSMHAVARTLKGVGIDLTDLTTYAVDLHDYQYTANETRALEDASAYDDGPSLVGYILVQDGLSSHNLDLLYYSMPFTRMTMNTEQLTWYVQT